MGLLALPRLRNGRTACDALGFIYLMANQQGTEFKLGLSTNPMLRMEQLPDDIDVSRSVAIQLSRRRLKHVEAALQLMFSDFWVHDRPRADGSTEWFRMEAFGRCLALVDHAKDILGCGSPVPLESIGRLDSSPAVVAPSRGYSGKVDSPNFVGPLPSVQQAADRFLLQASPVFTLDALTSAVKRAGAWPKGRLDGHPLNAWLAKNIGLGSVRQLSITWQEPNEGAFAKPGASATDFLNALPVNHFKGMWSAIPEMQDSPLGRARLAIVSYRPPQRTSDLLIPRPRGKLYAVARVGPSIAGVATDLVQLVADDASEWEQSRPGRGDLLTPLARRVVSPLCGLVQWVAASERYAALPAPDDVFLSQCMRGEVKSIDAWKLLGFAETVPRDSRLGALYRDEVKRRATTTPAPASAKPRRRRPGA